MDLTMEECDLIEEAAYASGITDAAKTVAAYADERQREIHDSGITPAPDNDVVAALTVAALRVRALA